MNPQPTLNHIVLVCRSVELAKDFYCGDLGLKNRSQEDRFLSVEIGNFVLNFSESSEFQDQWALGIGHIGLQFTYRSDVDSWYSRFRESAQVKKLSRIMGGGNEGPYRFYVQDPHGYSLEFESWEGSGD